MIDLQFGPYEVRMSFRQFIKELAEISHDFDNDYLQLGPYDARMSVLQFIKKCEK